MIAIIVQYKDLDGTVVVAKPPTRANRYTLEEVVKIQTKSSGFTQIASTILTSDLGNRHILLVTSCPDNPCYPKMWVLTENCKGCLFA